MSHASQGSAKREVLMPCLWMWACRIIRQHALRLAPLLRAPVDQRLIEWISRALRWGLRRRVPRPPPLASRPRGCCGTSNKSSEVRRTPMACADTPMGTMGRSWTPLIDDRNNRRKEWSHEQHASVPVDRCDRPGDGKRWPGASQGARRSVPLARDRGGLRVRASRRGWGPLDDGALVLGGAGQDHGR